MIRSLPQPLKFVAVGTGGFLLNLLAFTVLFDAGVVYVASSLIAYLCSNAAMYLGHRYWTFYPSRSRFLTAFLRYAVVGAIVALATAALLAVLVEGAGLGPRPGQALALATLVPLSFFLSKRWAFERHAVLEHLVLSADRAL